MDKASYYQSLDERVGDNLRLARRAANLSIDELAHQLDCSREQVVAYEAGRLRISAVTLHQISKLLGIAVSQFFDQLAVHAHGSEPPRPESGDTFGELSLALRKNTTFSDLIAVMQAATGHDGAERAA
jgi:transcriptional regulator with XRE-family HTH domain